MQPAVPVSVKTWRHPERIAEIVSVLLGFVYIVLSVAQNPACWGFGIVSVGIQTVIVFRQRLFMDALLQFVFFLLGFYGLYMWLRGGEGGGALTPSHLTQDLGILIGGICLAALLLIWPLMRGLKAAYPFFDTLATVLCLAAQYLQSLMIIENWLIYIVGDIICVVLYYKKRLYGYALLLVIYTIWAAIGYFQWQP